MTFDEALVFFIATFTAVGMMAHWYRALVHQNELGQSSGRLLLHIIPVVSLLCVFIPILFGSAVEVRTAFRYIWLFTAAGVAWYMGFVRLSTLVGVRLWEDGFVQRNGAATWMVSGLMVSLALIFGGANIGEGETIWTTFGPAALATLGLFLGLVALDTVSSVFRAVAVDRDNASGIRVACALVASGLVLGRAVAGDYHSLVGTVVDFAFLAAPYIVILIMVTFFQALFGPTAKRPKRSAFWLGVLPGSTMFLLALAWLLYLGSVQ